MGLSSNICLISNRSSEKPALLYTKMSKSIPKPHFQALLWVLCAQNPIFMGSIKLKMGLSCKHSLITNRSNVNIGLLCINYLKIPTKLSIIHWKFVIFSHKLIVLRTISQSGSMLGYHYTVYMSLHQKFWS